ncbi:MAG: energy-coupling factor transporter transmembrane protein EcfT [Candidatus Schekmanbacteria bacterium]|nr:energy-coupling factor transporter transmembrane protein EcfT [Candidatus Schekmanbacteria bacterium]
MFSPQQPIFGQYRDGDHGLYLLDARIKLICLLILVGIAFYRETAVFLILPLLAAAIGASRLPYRLIARWLLKLKWFLIFTFFFHLLFTPGYFIPYLVWHERGITYEGLHNGAYISLRLLIFLAASSLLTLTTSPGRLVDGLGKLLSPLKRFNFPVQDLALMIMFSLHFLPLLWQEADRLRKAQIARGISFSQGGLVQRIKSLSALTVPLIFSAFRRADNLALSMEIRRYRSDVSRTSLYPGKLQFMDYLSLMTVLGIAFLAYILGNTPLP